MRPQVSIKELDERDPHMLRWVEVMARHGGGRPTIKYGAPLFCSLRNQLLMIKDCAYAGTDLCRDPELALLKGE